jgi:hypothetical protein
MDLMAGFGRSRSHREREERKPVEHRAQAATEKPFEGSQE